MDLFESVESRKSVRAFRPDPVPRSVLAELLERAARAPSWGNTQPWDLAVASGTKLEQIRQGFADKNGRGSGPDIARPRDFPEPYASRRRPPGGLRSPGQAPPARPATSRFYGAPCVVYICTGRSYYFQEGGVNAWAIFDCGLIAENIMLLATGYGLGTVALAQAVAHPDVLRTVLQVPDSLLLVVGIAIGYADDDDPVNHRRSAREPLDRIVTWSGFE